MAHTKLAELVSWLRSITKEAKREADYRVDARDLLGMLVPASRATGEQPATQSDEAVVPTTARPGYSFTEGLAEASEVERDGSPDETAVPEWTVIGVRWNESPDSVVALTALPGRQQPADNDVSDELTGWVRHVHALNSDAALRLGKASAASAPSVAAFRADDS
ncbi:hypothetical protein OG413_41390 [Streptomyces sp. NBC_01433]|uniref:hypothetical protein n=1 Tax=Streptomyces sp. NBC_01433 TaxID=2903864 RepID=UPI00225B9CF5|nr:hypothetical protein [Streptomyces sp. NBC_01433]MCX4681658.1 hypothetical protein [Streptomyces sp. NBC_01433]